MKHQFSQVPSAKIPRSSFNRSHGLKTTINSGLLIPFFLDEVLPGDTLNLRANIFGRMATPLKPVMDNLFLETFFFFVPNRLVWDNWQKFNGEQDNPGDSTDFSVPTVTLVEANTTLMSISDYFGVPTKFAGAMSVSALPYRGYNLIYNEWFRDQNLQNSVPNFKDNGPDAGNSTNYKLIRRGKRHDYFTSCLPWAQKGQPVTVNLGGNAPVHANTTAAAQSIGVISDRFGAPDKFLVAGNDIIGNDPNAIAPDATLYANLATATGFTINDLRQSFAIQRLLERDARGGTRYIEIIRSHFGVTSPDARLQRPEFLGGGTTMVNINPVAQTAGPGSGAVPFADTPQGNLAAYGTVSASNHGFTKSFVEHGHVIGLVNVRADLTYQQGLNRLWSRRTRYDYYWPALSHLGEMAVLSKELYYAGVPADDDKAFGYNEAWADYRYKPSQITGQFRSNAAGTLDPWHYSQNFATRPVLSDEFIQDNPPIKRTIAVQSEPEFLLDAYFNYRCARPMPLYGVPGLIDHF